MRNAMPRTPTHLSPPSARFVLAGAVALLGLGLCLQTAAAQAAVAESAAAPVEE